MVIIAVFLQLTDMTTFLIAAWLQGSYTGEINPLIHQVGPLPVALLKLLWIIAVLSYVKVFPGKHYWLAVPIMIGSFGTLTNLYYLFTEVL